MLKYNSGGAVQCRVELLGVVIVMAGRREFWIYTLMIVCVTVIEAEKKSCNQKVKCDECITAHPNCAWCKSKEFTGTRCSTVEDLQENLCDDISHPNNSATILKNVPLRDGSPAQEPVQLSPQHIKIKLKPGEKYYMDMKYRVAHNLPIDMYFVLDFSTTMRAKIQDLADLTTALIDGLSTAFTNNIHIGFGSFLDKRVQPFTITVPIQLENPCITSADGGNQCERNYGYIHRWKLSNDIDEFVKTIKNANVSANFDPMEGGLDAVLQASVCPDIIGWRNESRRVLIHISDGGFHFAGDGKLAGIDTPCDGLCHMVPSEEKKGEYFYAKSSELDYPSFGQLKQVLKENRINAFFLASKQDTFQTYKKLTEFIGSQAATEEMGTAGAANTIQKIKDFYTALSSKMDISAFDLPDGMQVVAQTNCSLSRVIQTFNLKEKPIGCEGLEIGKEVFINVSIQVNECPKDRNGTKMFKLIPSGLQESLLIEVEYICDCECEHDEQLDIDQCSGGNGTYECGVCRCNEGRSGERCQCDTEDESEQSIDEDNCKKNNESSSVCEDRGSCKCGQCICSSNYDGKYCECDNSKCIEPGTTVKCTNKDQGDCACGICQCKNGYHGEFCQCPPQALCIAENGLECSGNGACECGKCVCKTGYNNTHCQDCPRCNNCLRCGNSVQKQCVSCLDAHESEDNATFTSCNDECSGLNVTKVARFGRDIQPCDTFVSESCKLNYIIQCSNDTISLMYATTRQCVNPPDPVLIAMPILAGIIGVGILLLIIWKILTTFYDKIEYAKFEHEVQNPKWSKTDNPIYNSPVTSNQNPAFKGNME